MLQEIIATSPEEVDLTNPLHAKKILETANVLIEQGYSLAELDRFEEDLISDNDKSYIFILLVLKIVRSKLIAKATSQPLLISVVFAVYKEHNRIRKQGVHPHGEDFLRNKVAQLQWLFDDQPNIEWELLIVDDGCPEGSGRIAQEIVDQEGWNNQVRILFLAEGIEERHPVARDIRSVAESQKGGSIAYGMAQAVRAQPKKDHFLVYTDADLSTHLGQIMLLVHPLLSQNKLAAIGSRREPMSVVIKQQARNDRGKLFIYLWKRMIPNLGAVVDSQCGFKAFRAEIIPGIIRNMVEKKFAFDIELLLRTELLQKDSIVKVPIAWIDSEAASTTTDLQPYLPMLKSIAQMNKAYLPHDEDSKEFVQFVESMDEKAFQDLLDNIPADITNREPGQFTEYDEVRVADLKMKR